MNIKSDDGPRRERNIALALVGLFILEKEGRPYDTAALDAFISLVFTRSAYNARDNASGKNHASGNKHHHGRIAASGRQACGFKYRVDCVVFHYGVYSIFLNCSYAHSINQYIYEREPLLSSYTESLIFIFFHGNGSLRPNTAHAFRRCLDVTIIRCFRLLRLFCNYWL